MTALLSDLDGVLVDSAAAVERSWRAFAGRHGLDPARVLAHAHGAPTRAVVEQLLGPDGAEAEAGRVEREQAEDTGGVRALDGAAELLAAPPARFAVVTSCTALLAHARLEAAGLPVPAVLVTADQLRRGKPDPEGYLRAAELVGAPPEDCVVVEDAPTGIRAGRAAGMRVIAVATTHAPEDLTGADLVVPGLGDALAAARG
jgi:sugar-phosphatase